MARDLAIRRIRTKAGRLTLGERRRRIRKSGAAPGETVILDVHERKKGGRRVGNSITVDFAVKAQFSVDLDVRKLIHAIRLGLAVHFRESMLAGQKPDGFGPHPRPASSTIDRTPGRPAIYGVISGDTARGWYLGEVRGGPFRASARITPARGGELDTEGLFRANEGRPAMISYAISVGVEFLTVEGAAAELIQETTDAWLRLAVPASGDGVATPAKANTQGGPLPGFNA